MFTVDSHLLSAFTLLHSSSFIHPQQGSPFQLERSKRIVLQIVEALQLGAKVALFVLSMCAQSTERVTEAGMEMKKSHYAERDSKRVGRRRG